MTTDKSLQLLDEKIRCVRLVNGLLSIGFFAAAGAVCYAIWTLFT